MLLSHPIVEDTDTSDLKFASSPEEIANEFISSAILVKERGYYFSVLGIVP